MSIDNSMPPSLRPGRRGFLGSAGVAAAGIALAGTVANSRPADAAATASDIEILNFALNLEYLEAEYYLRATTGMGLSSSETSGTGTQGKVVSVPLTPMVNFTTPAIAQYANEISQDEHNHVLLLRSVLGTSTVAEPSIDIGHAFNMLAQAAGIGSSFDPYASELNFLLGAFVFEDVGVTAYHGAAPLISDKGVLSAAAGLLGVEAYHASEVRTLLASLALSGQYKADDIFATVAKISALRRALNGNTPNDQTILVNGVLNIVPTDSNSLIFSRTTHQVLQIVYGNTTPATQKGLFFPNGMNGAIS